MHIPRFISTYAFFLISTSVLAISTSVLPTTGPAAASVKSPHNRNNAQDNPQGNPVESQNADVPNIKGESRAQQDLHLLNRITFGPTAQGLATLRSMGRESYIRRQLNPDSIDESPAVASFVKSSDALNRSPVDLFRRYGPPAIMAAARTANKNNNDPTSGVSNGNVANNGSAGTNSGNASSNNGNEAAGNISNGPNDGGSTAQADSNRKAKTQARQALYHDIDSQITTARLMRAIYSPCQLEEVMADFWFNHFNVSMKKGLDHIWVGSYEEEAIRPYALGKFRDLLEATSHHPAMLFYLDNWENTAPGSPGAHGNFTGINENYARELMELHTLGVDGGYTQKDVTELARILTGLGIPRPGARANQQRWMTQRGMFGLGGLGPMALARNHVVRPLVRNYFSGLNINSFGSTFDENRHDFGDKIFLGHVITGAGEKEIEEALDMLARHLSTAHHISYQLAQYFVSDTPPTSLVDRLTAKFTQTDGDIKAVMSELLHSPEFWDSGYENCKYKNPFRYVISVLRITNAQPANFRPILAFLNQQGMPLYGCQTPDGYKNTKEAWLNSDALLRRLSFSTAVGFGRFSGNIVQPPDFFQIKEVLSGLDFSTSTTNAVAAGPAVLKSALLLGSPEFMQY